MGLAAGGARPAVIELPHAVLPTFFAALLVVAQYRRMRGT